MKNQPTQLLLDFSDKKEIHVIRLGDTRARDSEGHYTTEDKDDGSDIDRLKVQLQVLRTNCSIWLKNRDTEIEKLKEKLKKYEL